MRFPASDGTTAQALPSSLLPSPSSSAADMAIRPLSLAYGDHPDDHQADRQESHHGRPPRTKSPQIIEDVPPALSSVKPSPEEQDRGCSHTPSPLSTLTELARLLRSRDQSRRRAVEIQDRLRSLQITTARTNRLLHTAQSVQHTLAECIKSEDKQSFSNLFNAFLDASDRISVDSVFEMEPRPDHHLGYRASTFDLISASSRALLMDLCHRLRHDGNFIADCFLSLSHKELLAMLPDCTLSRTAESVFGSTSWHHPRTSRHLGFVVDRQMELLQSSEFASPLHAMLHFARSISTDPAAEDLRMLEVWATVCARLIVDQKAGSEKVVPAVLDAVVDPVRWAGRSRLEGWISQTLERGAFLAEKPSKQSFRTRVLGQTEISAEDQNTMEAFYSESVSSLLDMLGDNQGPSLIPQTVLKMCHAISAKLGSDSARQRAFPQFVITRWLSSSFLPELLVLPEVSNDVPY
nr:hypothetical protein CFP56_30824 [Quercus suber]